MKTKNKKMEEFLKEVERPISSVKEKPIKAWTVPQAAIEALNANIAVKLEQNRRERIASELDAEGKIVV